jgi:2-polyprenyl-3-methyl-5-hydroxy-6-metoxy-1,4-benzoquinol methylase
VVRHARHRRGTAISAITLDPTVLDRQSRRSIRDRFFTRRMRAFIAVKLACDPVYQAAAEARGASTLPLIDIGCGIGLLAHYLHGVGRLHGYFGFDHDARKVDTGNAAIARGGLGSNVRLACGDAVARDGRRGDVALLDVLHYLPRERQPELLGAAAAMVADDGVLVLRNVVREPNWRFRLTVWEEHLLEKSGWIPGGAQHYPDEGEIREPLEQAGLKVTMRPLRGRTPYNSFLLVARPG